MKRFTLAIALTLFSTAGMCSTNDIYPEMFNPACGYGGGNCTTAMQQAVNYVIQHNGRLCGNAGASYLVTDTIIADVGMAGTVTQSDGFKLCTNGGIDINGVSITDQPTWAFRCSGQPNGCNNLVLDGRLTVKGSNAYGPALEIGNADGSDWFNGLKLDYVIGQNFATGGSPIGIRIGHVSGLRGRISGYVPWPQAGSIAVVAAGLNGAHIDMDAAAQGGTPLVLLNCANGISDTADNIIRLSGVNGVVCISVPASGTRVRDNDFVHPIFSGCQTGIAAYAGSNHRLIRPSTVGLSVLVAPGSVGVVVE